MDINTGIQPWPKVLNQSSDLVFYYLNSNETCVHGSLWYSLQYTLVLMSSRLSFSFYYSSYTALWVCNQLGVKPKSEKVAYFPLIISYLYAKVLCSTVNKQ